MSTSNDHPNLPAAQAIGPPREASRAAEDRRPDAPPRPLRSVVLREFWAASDVAMPTSQRSEKCRFPEDSQECIATNDYYPGMKVDQS